LLDNEILQDDFIEPSLYELLDREEIMTLCLLNDTHVKPIGIRSNSVSALNEIYKKEKMHLDKDSKLRETTHFDEKRKSRRYTIANNSDLKQFVSNYKRINQNNRYKKNSSSFKLNTEMSTYSFSNITEPEIYAPKLNNETKIQIELPNKKLQNRKKSLITDSPYQSKNYNEIKSKLKFYIRSNRNVNSKTSYTQRKNSQYAINTHIVASSKHLLENDFSELKICSQLVKTIQKDVKSHKGLYFAG
jgi:hypothetical protein